MCGGQGGRVGHDLPPYAVPAPLLPPPAAKLPDTVVPASDSTSCCTACGNYPGCAAWCAWPQLAGPWKAKGPWGRAAPALSRRRLLTAPTPWEPPARPAPPPCRTLSPLSNCQDRLGKDSPYQCCFLKAASGWTRKADATMVSGLVNLGPGAGGPPGVNPVPAAPSSSPSPSGSCSGATQSNTDFSGGDLITNREGRKSGGKWWHVPTSPPAWLHCAMNTSPSCHNHSSCSKVP